MKKLSKLLIDSDKIMKSEELVTLRGGYDKPCGYKCSSDSDCWGWCTHCSVVPGMPYFNVCTNS